MPLILALKTSCTFTFAVDLKKSFQTKHKAAVCINLQPPISIHPSITN